MTNQQHPITPPPDLVQSWYDDKTDYFMDMIRAAQWGADQELEACCEWLKAYDYDEVGRQLAEVMHATRRTKPLSLKEQALAVLEEEPEDSKELIVFDTDQVNIIRRALEQLDD